MADKTEFLQAIDDAILDADSLERFINGSDSEMVLTRLSAKYPTLKKAIKQMFESGGLPATPFASMEQMESSDMADGGYAVITSGADVGLYYKTNGSWQLTDYDNHRVVNAIRDRVDKSSSVIKQDGEQGILRLLDANDSTVVFIDQNGDIRISGIDNTVQELLRQIKTDGAGQGVSNVVDTLFAVVDAGSNPLISIDGDGDVYIHNLRHSLQKILRKFDDTALLTSEIKASNRGYSKNIRDDYKNNDIFNALIKNAITENIYVCPPARHMTLNNMQVGSDWVDDVGFETDIVDDGQVIVGYDDYLKEDIGVVHPQVWEFDGRVAGYRYWMAITPYTDNFEDYEIPYIYGTNDPDLKSWELIDGFPAPFEDDPKTWDDVVRGHLSDPAMCYDPNNGDLVLIWRKSLFYSDSTTKNAIMACRYDGNGWSDNYELMPLFSNDAILAPSIVFNPNNKLFYMYYVRNYKLVYRTCDNLNGGGWSSATECVLNNNGNVLWHIDVKCLGGKVVVLIHSDGTMTSSSKDAYYFAVSSDFKSFNVSTNSVISTTNPHVYKASFLPSKSSGSLTNVTFRIIYTSDDSTADRPNAKTWQLRVSKTNSINLEK